MYRAFLPSLMVLFAASTIASPVSSGALSARQAGTYDGPDALDPTRSGTFHCFRGGNWLPQAGTSGVIDQACGTGSHDYDDTHLSLNSTGPQQFEHLFRSCWTVQAVPVCASPSGGITFSADIKSPGRGNSQDCTYAMQRIVDICHGQHQDTRGGWWQYDGDGTTYGIDPAE